MGCRIRIWPDLRTHKTDDAHLVNTVLIHPPCEQNSFDDRLSTFLTFILLAIPILVVSSNVQFLVRENTQSCVFLQVVVYHLQRQALINLLFSDD